MLFPTSLEATLEACPLVQHAYCHMVQPAGHLGVVIVPSPLAAGLPSPASPSEWLDVVRGLLGNSCQPKGVLIAHTGPWSPTNGFVNGMGKKCRGALAAEFQGPLAAALELSLP